MKIVRLLLFLALAPWTLPAQDPVTVDVALLPPNVMEVEGQEGHFEGFDIDLWQEIARLEQIGYTFRKVPFEELLHNIETGAADVGLAGITMTGDREARMDFSYAYMRSGLRILANAEQRKNFLEVAGTLFHSGAFRWLWYLLLFLVLCSHLLYFAERGTKAIDRRYFPGIFEAGWCTIATVTTVGYGDITPHGWTGRLVAFLVMVSGIGLFGIVIAELSAGLTLQQLTSDIRGPGDLRGRTVATVAGTTSVEASRAFGAEVIEVQSIEEAGERLRGGQADAVVFDSPTLLFYLRNHTDEDLILAGGLLRNESYGIAFPAGSPLRERVNRALLQIRESGTYDTIYRKWFGTEQ